VSEIYVAVVLLSLLSCVTTCIGVASALVFRKSPRAIAAGIGFSAGIMILISVLELLPESIATARAGPILLTAAAGAALVWAAHFAVPHIHLVEERGLTDRVLVRSAYLVALGLILHDLPEGFAMANAYVASPDLGVLVALAIALHNLPEEFAMAVPAVTLRSRRFLFGAALLSALAEPVGAIIGLGAVAIAPSLNAHFLAFAAGAMLFVSFHELLPLARRYRHAGMFTLGMIASALLYWLLARATVGQIGWAAP
jgi:ZIP family zinc transporter